MNELLALAEEMPEPHKALTLGVVTGLQRRVTGGILGPVVTHLTWSLGMLFVLPVVLDAAG